MHRNRGSNYNNYGGAGNATALAVQNADRDEDDFKKLINKNHLYTKLFAQRLTNNEFKDIFTSAAESSSSADAEEQFLEAKREALKAVTRCNIQNERSISVYKETIQDVCKLVDSEDAEESKSDTNYEHVAIEILREKQSNLPDTMDIENHRMMKEICEALGEKTDGDDELEVVSQHGEDQESSLKCPILATFYEKPMRNTECGHVYSLEGIKHHLRTKKKCPVAGCTNMNVTLSQLVEDEEMTMKIRRFKLRAQNANHFQFSQTVDDDDDEYHCKEEKPN